MNHVEGLSTQLEGVLEFEVKRGNQIERIDRPAGSTCPLAVILKQSLDVAGFVSANGMPAGVRTWENRDRHYPLEKGFVCEKTKHAIAGPLMV